MTPDSSQGKAVRHDLGLAERERLMRHMGEGLAEVNEILFAYAFGSFVEGRSFEDIDIAVYTQPARPEAFDVLGFTLDLTRRLERAAGLPVEVVALQGAPLGLRLSALRGRLIFSRDEVTRVAILEDTSSRAMDMAYLARDSLRDLLQMP